MTTLHTARVTSSATLAQVEAYMPSNYTATVGQHGEIIIQGHDNAGWTMEDYVKPRLASGLIFVEDL